MTAHATHWTPEQEATLTAMFNEGATVGEIADALAFAEDPWNHGCLPEMTLADRDAYAVLYRAMQSPEWSGVKPGKPAEAPKMPAAEPEPPRHWSERAGADDPRHAELRRARIAAGVIRE